MIALQDTWFALIAVLFTGYAVLDGFDLGLGAFYLKAKTDHHRRTLLRSIGPVWDGNEVWLLTGGGAMFAAFPHVYATVFSGFYLALILVLAALIFRAASIEFRNADTSPAWRQRWDLAFALGSMLAALLFGVALGNILRGVPLDARMEFTGSFFTLLNPYALLIGLTGFFMLATHGALYAAHKTEGELSADALRWARLMWTIFVPLLAIAMVTTEIMQPHLVAKYHAWPILYLIPLFALGAAVKTLTRMRAGETLCAFLASSATIVGLMVLCAVGLYPNLVPALGSPELSLTAHNASSSHLTLRTMLIIAAIGMPLVLLYTAWVYRMFGGKVILEEETATESY